jgi:hypothetical protein
MLTLENLVLLESAHKENQVCHIEVNKYTIFLERFFLIPFSGKTDITTAVQILQNGIKTFRVSNPTDAI